MKRTYIVGDTPILHNGDRLPPGSSIALTFDELRSLGLPLQELPQPAAESVLAAELVPDVAEPPATEQTQGTEQVQGSEQTQGTEQVQGSEQTQGTEQTKDAEQAALSAVTTKTRKKGA